MESKHFKKKASVREYTDEEKKWCSEVYETIAKVLPHSSLECKRAPSGTYYGINVWLISPNRRKAICRLYLEGKEKKLVILDNKKEAERLTLHSSCGVCKLYKEEITKYTKLIKRARHL